MDKCGVKGRKKGSSIGQSFQQVSHREEETKKERSLAKTCQRTPKLESIKMVFS